MRYSTEMVRDLHIAYIGGGSRGWAWGFMKDLAMDGDMTGTVCLYDIDREAAVRNRMIGERISAHPAAKARWNYRVAHSLQDALTGADFVVISILPGTFDEMHSDVHEPETYGIYQSVGDTVGPGGIVRALRAVPMFVQIAEAIRDCAPKAWVINYTNPMALCIRTLYRVFPDVRAFGCCHEVFGTQKLLCAALEEITGVRGLTRQELATNVFGVNHFTWINRASYRGTDLFPVYRQFVDRFYETGYTEGGDDNWMNNSFACAHRVKFDLFRRYGLIAAAGDRHLAEFLPPWYLGDAATVAAWKFGLTTVDWRRDDLRKRMAKSVGLSNGSEPLELEPSGEEGHLLMKALLGLGDLISNVNLPNAGQIPNLPVGAVVETNALFRYASIEPVMAGCIPANVLGLVMPHAINQELVLNAALHCDRSLALQAMLNDPLVTLAPPAAEKLLLAMLKNTKNDLPAQWEIA